MNMVEIVMDDEKILREGIYTPESVQNALNELFINIKHLRREGNRFIDDHPYDAVGVIMPCMFILAGKQWFRDYVKVMHWYREEKAAISPDGSPVYYEEDVKANLIDHWEETRRREGLPINK